MPAVRFAAQQGSKPSHPARCPAQHTWQRVCTESLFLAPLCIAFEPPHPRAVADISELDLPKNTSIRFPDGNNKIMNFEVVLKPDEGLYK